MRKLFVFLVAVPLVSLLSACGAGCNDNMRRDLYKGPAAPDAASARPAVPCNESAECMARVMDGQKIARCDEAVRADEFGRPAMMSTWDEGKTWLIGNCDDTAK